MKKNIKFLHKRRLHASRRCQHSNSGHSNPSGTKRGFQGKSTLFSQFHDYKIKFEVSYKLTISVRFTSHCVGTVVNAERQIRFLKFDPMVRFVLVVATEPVTDTMMAENCPVQHFLVDIFNPSLSLCGRC